MNEADAGRETGVRVSTDPAALDLDWLTAALSERAYWALGRARETIEASIVGSRCFGAYDGDGRQVGFARVITDGATFGWVCDVFVDEAARGSGVGRSLLEAITTDERVRACRLVLATRDAHRLYAAYGFAPLRNPDRWMARPRPGS